MPGDRPERRREIEVRGREIAGRGDLAAALQSIRPCPLIVPLTSAITPSVSRVSSSGWRFGPKVRPGHVEQRVARRRSKADARSLTSVTSVPLPDDAAFRSRGHNRPRA